MKRNDLNRTAASENGTALTGDNQFILFNLY
jgi:hypothetical protein